MDEPHLNKKYPEQRVTLHKICFIVALTKLHQLEMSKEQTSYSFINCKV